MAKGTVNYTPKGPSKRDIDFDVYTERDVTKTQVNWADVAKKITGEIETIRDDRQGRKDEIQKATDEAMTKLDDTGQYDNKTMMDLVIDGSNFAANSMHTQKKLMEQGLIKPHDYTKFTSNVSAGFKTFKTTAEGWDKDFQEYTKRMEDCPGGPDCSSSIEQYLANQVKGFGNINDMQLFTNPQTGNMALASTYVDDNGITRMNEDPSTHISMQRLLAMSKQRVNKIHVGDVATSASEEMGTYIKMIHTQFKGTKSIEDITQSDDFAKLVRDKAKETTTNDMAAASILSDSMMTADGGKYKAGTQDEHDQWETNNPCPEGTPAEECPINPIIAMTYNQETQMDEPNLSEEQRTKATDYLEAAIRGKMPHKETGVAEKYPPAQPRETNVSQGIKDREKRYANHYENIEAFITGDPAAATTAANSLATRINKEMLGKKDYIPVQKIERIEDIDGNVTQYVIHKKGQEPYIVEGTVDGQVLSSDQIAEAIFDKATGGDLTYKDVAGDRTMGDRGQGGASSEQLKKAKLEKSYDRENNILVGGQPMAVSAVISDVGDLRGGNFEESVQTFDTVLKEIFKMSSTPGIKEAFADEDISITRVGNNNQFTVTIGDVTGVYPVDLGGDDATDQAWDDPNEKLWPFVETIIQKAIDKKRGGGGGGGGGEGDDILDGDS